MSTIQLMPHQKKAIERLQSGSILCGGVGTGKSLTALAFYFRVICRGVLWCDVEMGPMLEPKDLYIITTARKRDTKEWEAEIERFGLDNKEVKITIDSWNNLHKYVDVSGAFFIFDEQRAIGRGNWSKCFIKVTKKNQWILLSATPGDTWMDYVPVFIANGFYKNRREFVERHVVYSPFVTKYPKIDRFLEVGYLESLRRKITVLMKFEKTTIPHWKTLKDGKYGEYDLEKYKQIAKDRWDPWKNEPIPDISSCCYLMRKVVNLNPGRCRKALWIALNSQTHRAIIFYNFDYELQLLKDEIEQAIADAKEQDGEEKFRDVYGDFEMAEWNGHKHEAVPKSKSWIYLVQYTAGAEGWNCTETDTIIFYSRNYSYKLMTQAAGRIDRMNTPFTDLYYYVLTSSAPIDLAIEKALKGKKNFNEKMFWINEVREL